MNILVKFTIPFLAIMVSCDSSKNDALVKGTNEHLTAVTSAIDDQVLANAKNDSKNWLSYGLNYSENRFSQLEEVSEGNVDKLGLLWSYDLNSIRGGEATPVVVVGLL